MSSVSGLLQLAILTKFESGSSLADIERYNLPTLLAIGLLAFDFVWPIRQTNANPVLQVTEVSVGSTRPEIAAFRWSRATWPRVIALPLTVTLTWTMFTLQRPSFFWSNFSTNLKSGLKVVMGSAGFHEQYSSFYRTEYANMNSLIPAGSHVLAAVDRPYLLDISKFDFATLDIVGNVSPPPGMPLSTPRAVVNYLSGLGYRYLVESSENVPGLYWKAQWQLDLADPVYVYRKWAHFSVSWDPLVGQIESSKYVSDQYSRFLTLISLSR